MKAYRAEASATIDAPAALVYSIIADYRNGHPHILPKPYFLDLEVERGGVGAGTVIRFRMRVMGKTQTFRAAVTEPEPGRVLVESDLDGGPRTTFTVEPLEGSRRARVSFETVGEARSRLLGPVERFFTVKMLRRIYARELEQLAAVAQERARASTENAAGP